MKIDEQAIAEISRRVAASINTAVLSPKEAARYIGISEAFLNKIQRKKQVIPKVKLGSLTRYRKQDLDDYLASQLEASK